MHSLWLDNGLLLIGGFAATILMACLFYAGRVDRRLAEERRNLKVKS